MKGASRPHPGVLVEPRWRARPWLGLDRSSLGGLGGLAALVALAALVSGCNIDTKALEANIEEGLEEKGVKIKSIECPKRKVKKGDEFTCSGETKAGDEFEIEVTQSGQPGDMQWELVGAIVDEDSVKDMIEDDIPKGAEIDCGGKARILKKGDKLECDVEADGEEAELTIKVKSDDGKVEWKLRSK
jgi:hypothetical protein